MRPLPSVAPFATVLADLAADLRRGTCCLVTADKGWAPFLVDDLRERLKVAELRCVCIDGRPAPGETQPNEVGVMLTAITQLRRAVRGGCDGAVVVLPHLDLMATGEGGWTSISRELVPLLYEDSAAVLLGFRDPSLPLLPVVEKLFARRYTIEHPFREAVAVPPLRAGAAGPEAEPGGFVVGTA
jgi:hypothetical protein